MNVNRPSDDIVIGAKYLPMYQGGEQTRVFNSTTCHWKMAVSTVMTFAARLKTLKEDVAILRHFTAGSYPRDHDMFQELRKKGRVLITPLPAYSTHGGNCLVGPA
jgi:hypothetical protein